MAAQRWDLLLLRHGSWDQHVGRYCHVIILINNPPSPRLESPVSKGRFRGQSCSVRAVWPPSCQAVSMLSHPSQGRAKGEPGCDLQSLRGYSLSPGRPLRPVCPSVLSAMCPPTGPSCGYLQDLRAHRPTPGGKEENVEPGTDRLL